MNWIARRLDHLGSATAGGVGGLGFSQAPAFTHAYLQRLGGHIDEARLTIQRVADAQILPWLGEAERERALVELGARLTELEQLRQQVLDAPALLRPAQLLGHADWSIAQRTAQEFAPAIPIDIASLTWTCVGIVAAVLIYELIQVPVWARQRRKARQAISEQSQKPRKTSALRPRSGAAPTPRATSTRQTKQ